jgi:hypothetical protein
MSACLNYAGNSILVATYETEGSQLWLLDPANLSFQKKLSLSFAGNANIDQYRIYTIAKTGLGGYIMFGCHFIEEDDLQDNIGSMLFIDVSADLTVGGHDLESLKGQTKIKYFYEFEENYWSDEEPPIYKL